jgi:small multidrug resistance pump
MFETMGTVYLKLSGRFSKIVPSIMVFVFYGLGFILLIKAVEKIDISTVYAIWSGLGIVMVSIIRFLYFKETVNIVKVVCIVLIIVGVVGLR